MVKDTLPWTKKHCPTNSSEIIAQEQAMTDIKKYIETYKEQKKKGLIIYGPSGCGKTSSVYAIANEKELEVIEINASDLRNKDQINMVVGGACKQMSLFGKGKIILVDEIDGIAGKKDYGGIAALAKLVKESCFPIIMTANNPFDNKFSNIRNKSEMVGFKGLGIEESYKILEKICKKEKIGYDEDSLRSLAVRSAGDARGAVTDLQIITSINGKVEKDSVIELSERNKLDSMLNALVKIFKTTDENVAIKALENVQEDLDQSILWIDENLPKEYENPSDLASAYDKLSRADVFRGRIRRWMHWRYLIYVNALITAGIAVSKKNKKKGYIAYKPTGRILKLWWAKQKNMKKKAIAEKIAQKTHTSKKRIEQNIEFYKVIFKNNPEMADSIAEELELGKEEIEYLRK